MVRLVVRRVLSVIEMSRAWYKVTGTTGSAKTEQNQGKYGWIRKIYEIFKLYEFAQSNSASGVVVS
jgi:hypothetical protein